MNTFSQRFRAFKHRRRITRAKAELATRQVSPTPHGLDSPLVVSLTSYPARFDHLALTLRCLLAQTIQPDQVLLWIAKDDIAVLPGEVRALTAQGLEIGTCRDMRSYKKILPTLAASPEATIVTADDDVYYDADWLARIVAARQASGAQVVCTRGHHIALDDAGLPGPYQSWDLNMGHSAQSGRVFPTGVLGVLYAPRCFADEVTHWDTAAELCPMADDVWLYWMHRMTGATARKFGGRTRILEWEQDSVSTLRTENLSKGGNDRQIANMIRRYGFPPL